MIMHVYAFDPGQMTGWCHLSVHSDGEIGIFACGEGDHSQIGGMLFDNPALKAVVGRAEIDVEFVVEKYVMNSKISQSPWSLETTGLIRYASGIYHIPLHFQTPSQAKNLITNDVIKRAGFWEPGKGHAMDAVRHCLFYFITKKGVLKECLK